jgi:hypothetical protein
MYLLFTSLFIITHLVSLYDNILTVHKPQIQASVADSDPYLRALDTDPACDPALLKYVKLFLIELGINTK